MNLRTGTVIGAGVLSAFLWKGYSSLDAQDAHERSGNAVPNQNTAIGLEEDPQAKRFKRLLQAALSRSSSLIDEQDPCLAVSEAALEAKADEASSYDLKKLEEELEDCRATLSPEELKVSERNFNIVESITSYEKSCGGAKAEDCRNGQEELIKGLEQKGFTDWVYSSEIEWAYDKNGEVVDAKAFPGYQQYFQNGDHQDLISFSVKNDNGEPLYGVAVSCHREEGGSVAVFSGHMRRTEEVASYLTDLE